MLDTDPMAEALAGLTAPSNAPPPARPYRTKKGAIKFQPESDWSLDRLPEIESEFQQATGRTLPVSVRGQGAIHNKWNWAHDNSADIGLSPNSPEGQALMAQLQRQNVPFLAFDRAIPGVSTGEHIHIGRGSRRMGQSQSDRPAVSISAGDPMAEALGALGKGQQRPARPARPQRPFTPAGPFSRATPERQAEIRRAIPPDLAELFKRVSPEQQEIIRQAIDAPPVIRGQRMGAMPRVASEAVLEGSAGWTQSLATLSELLPDVMGQASGMAGIVGRAASTGRWNPVAEKLQEATNELRRAAQQVDIDPATGQPFRDAMSYWQSVPLDVLQGGVKAGFDIPRYVLMTRIAGPVMGFGIEGGLSAPPEDRAKGLVAGTAMGAAFAGLQAVKPLTRTLPRRIGSFAALGAGSQRQSRR